MPPPTLNSEEPEIQGLGRFPEPHASASSRQIARRWELHAPTASPQARPWPV